VAETPEPEEATQHGVPAMDVAWTMVAARIDAFAEAWGAPHSWRDADSPPCPLDFLPEGELPTRRSALLELIKLDMECRRAHGSVRTVEDYLSEFADLLDDEATVELVLEEIHLRRRQGESISRAEYAARFPALAQRVASAVGFESGIESARSASTRTNRGEDRKLSLAERFRPGDRIDDFDLVNQLGAGSFATVFLAWQRSMQRWVALKISAAGGAEPQTLAQLEHPFIVRVFDVRDIENGELRLLYMEYVRGGTLDDVQKTIAKLPREERSGKALLELLDEALAARHETPPQDSLHRALLVRSTWAETVCLLGSHLALALGYAKRRGVLHRDIKPANILLSASAFPKLADFNVSFGSEVQGFTASEFFGGSLAYMSPEQLNAMRPGSSVRPEDLDVTSDVYGLGIVLWELFSADRPFARPSAGVGKMEALDAFYRTRAQGVSREAIDRFPADAPPALLPILLKCLDPDPKRRYAEPDELARQLLLCLHPEVERLLWRRPTGWLAWSLRFPLFAIFLCVLPPNIILSALNIAYNARAVAQGWAPDLFDKQVTIVNLVAYSLGIALFLLYAIPFSRTIRAVRLGEREPAPAATLIGKTLALGPFAAWVTVVMWTCCGVVFPVWTHLAVGDGHVARYGHFFLSQVVCGILAGLFDYFLFTYLALRVWIPATISRTDVSPQAVEDLHRVPWRTRTLAGVYAAMPSACLLLLSFGDVRARFPFLALGIIGLLGFVVIVWLSREIQRNAAALRIALSPDPARTEEAERTSRFKEAAAIWSSVGGGERR
jgi:serine/threonine protein kinase